MICTKSFPQDNYFALLCCHVDGESPHDVGCLLCRLLLTRVGYFVFLFIKKNVFVLVGCLLCTFMLNDFSNQM